MLAIAILRTNIENVAFKHLISDYQFENLISRLSSLKIDMYICLSISESK